MDGTEYVSLNKIIEVGTGGENFLQRLSSKYRNERRIPLFVIPKNNIIEFHENFIWVLLREDEFETIHLSVTKDGELRDEELFGPAKGSEEAHKVYKVLKKV